MKTAPSWWKLLRVVQGLILPHHCCGCGRGIRGSWWCRKCFGGLPFLRGRVCWRCSQPLDGMVGPEATCPNCGKLSYALGAAVAVVRSRGVVRTLIHRLKYGGAVWAAKPLARLARRGFNDPRLAEPCDALVPVPLHFLRERERGYNQARLLSVELAKFRNWPVIEALERTRPTETQTHFNRRQRMRNLQKAFTLRQHTTVKNKHLVLVDDVLTTGSTLEECAKVLLNSGAASVRALTAARG